MAYTTKNFKTKKSLREAIKAGEKITVYQPGGITYTPHNGLVHLEGPHYPEPHRWYASGILKNGYLVSIK